MSTELQRAAEIDADIKAADARRKADAEESAMAGEKLDNILKCLDSLGRRMDAYESAAKEKGESGEDGDDEPEQKGDPKKLGADSRKDSRMDSAADEDRDEIESYAKERGELVPPAVGSAKFGVYRDAVLADVQSRIAPGYDAWGKSPRAPWDAERPSQYRRRILGEIKSHSPAWRDVDLHELRGQALRNAQSQIVADSISASSSPDGYGFDLREIRRRDPDTGHLIKEYYGSPLAWMSQFMPARRSAKFNLDRRRDDR
jgi:hypothetical protein